METLNVCHIDKQSRCESRGMISKYADDKQFSVIVDS